MKNFNPQEFKQNILDHYKVIETIYEEHTDTIAANITLILQESAQNSAPVTRIQISPKNSQTLSAKARQALSDRDLAQIEAKQDPSIENTRIFKNLRNLANIIITSERKERKRKMFEEEKQRMKLVRLLIPPRHEQK